MLLNGFTAIWILSTTFTCCCAIRQQTDSCVMELFSLCSSRFCNPPGHHGVGCSQQLAGDSSLSGEHRGPQRVQAHHRGDGSPAGETLSHWLWGGQDQLHTGAGICLRKTTLRKQSLNIFSQPPALHVPLFLKEWNTLSFPHLLLSPSCLWSSFFISPSLLL